MGKLSLRRDFGDVTEAIELVISDVLSAIPLWLSQSTPIKPFLCCSLVSCFFFFFDTFSRMHLEQ